MCTHKLPVLVLAAVSLAGVAAATRSRPASIQGVWQTTEVRFTGPGARTLRQEEPSLGILTPKHYSRVEWHAGRPRPRYTAISFQESSRLSSERPESGAGGEV